MKTLMATLLLVSTTSFAQSAAEIGFLGSEEMKWRDGPASLSKGARFAVLEGNPAEEGPFVVRFWLLQLHGVGPGSITYVPPADDPGSRK